MFFNNDINSNFYRLIYSKEKSKYLFIYINFYEI